MSVALIGLIGFQMYWINNAINVSEERFKQNVHEAIRSVSEKLEEQEVLYTAVKNLQITRQGRTVIGRDTVRFISRNGNKSEHDKIWVRKDDIKRWYLPSDSLGADHQSVEIEVDARERPGAEEEGVFINEDVLVEIRQFKADIDSIEEFDVTLNRTIQKVNEKSQMVTVVLNELLSKERKLENRLNARQIDTLLSTALRNRGIDISFDYGIINALKNELVLTNSTDHHQEVMNSEFRTSLFTRDIINQANFLSVFFPDQTYYLIGKLWFSLTSSIVLLLVIILCFAYAIRTIIKQKKISEIRNDFINNMTHEFKTPISTVSLACEALQDEDVNKSEGVLGRYLSIIETENRRLGTQVEKVLQMATLDKKDFKLKLETLDMHHVINQALKNIHIQVEKKGGVVSKNLNAEQSFVYADEVHLTNIVYNLLDNANKYAREKPEITIETENVDNGIVLRIIDKGIGMSKEVLNKIFEKFYRVPTGNIHDVKGFGLGLAYVKTMLDALGGRINVKSALQKGSMFEIYFPQNG
jgi:two-component system phosphate regulon sensor histidine kinase PhoR